PFELSGGQKRRAAIAGVIAMEPKVLILDEPAAGLDPKGRTRILDQIKEYHRQTGNTILLVSHSMEDVANYADKVLVMNEAKIFAYDTVENVFARSEELKSIRLAVPQVTNVFHRLHDEGFDVPENVYTVGYAKRKLLTILEEKGVLHRD
ncbi:MAG: AAA family ATPase, partial [Oscillospiraceae bacterium]|nr:AAA family ATPase [Oscillospiraceae bacterium]